MKDKKFYLITASILNLSFVVKTAKSSSKRDKAREMLNDQIDTIAKGENKELVNEVLNLSFVMAHSMNNKMFVEILDNKEFDLFKATEETIMDIYKYFDKMSDHE